MDEKRMPKEKQYLPLVELKNEMGLEELGLRANSMYQNNPRDLLFNFARYKFVSKMLSGKDKVLEVGCGDTFSARLVQAEINELHVLDFDPIFMDDVKARMTQKWKFHVAVHNILESPYTEMGLFDAGYSVDVIEHIEQKNEDAFMRNICLCLKKNAIFISGSPSLESQRWASSQSKAGHVNCKSGAEFKKFMEKYFYNVLMFSMNDEVIHTGFYPMSHFLFAIGIGNKVVD